VAAGRFGRLGVSELGLELADLVDAVLELGVGGVLADAADGPAQELGAAARDTGGDQRVHGCQVCGPEPGHHGGQLLLRFIRVPGLASAGAEPADGPGSEGAAVPGRLIFQVGEELDPGDEGQFVAQPFEGRMAVPSGKAALIRFSMWLADSLPISLSAISLLSRITSERSVTRAVPGRPERHVAGPGEIAEQGP
jgi:hypothetical protein